jgi:WD40 repeat protein
MPFSSIYSFVDLETGECLATFQGHKDDVNSVAYHPDGKTFISGSWDKTIIYWDLEAGECLFTIINLPGILLFGCSFMFLHSKSKFSEGTKNIMRQYGAIFDEQDKMQWNELVQRINKN